MLDKISNMVVRITDSLFIENLHNLLKKKRWALQCDNKNLSIYSLDFIIKKAKCIEENVLPVDLTVDSQYIFMYLVTKLR